VRAEPAAPEPGSAARQPSAGSTRAASYEVVGGSCTSLMSSAGGRADAPPQTGASGSSERAKTPRAREIRPRTSTETAARASRRGAHERPQAIAHEQLAPTSCYSARAQAPRRARLRCTPPTGTPGSQRPQPHEPLHSEHPQPSQQPQLGCKYLAPREDQDPAASACAELPRTRPATGKAARPTATNATADPARHTTISRHGHGGCSGEHGARSASEATRQQSSKYLSFYLRTQYRLIGPTRVKGWAEFFFGRFKARPLRASVQSVCERAWRIYGTRLRLLQLPSA